MQTAQPAYSASCTGSGVNNEPIAPPPEPTYAQSRQMEKVPRPSLPAAPPKTRVNQALSWLARQKTEIPVRVGAMYLFIGESLNATEVKGGYILREPLPNKDCNEDNPEETKTLLLQDSRLAAVECVKELDSWNNMWVYGECRVYKEVPHDT